MRLWTLHPKYLDPRGLVALWREALLAQKVLRGLTVGYRAHPQLLRFRAQSAPVSALATYLSGVLDEALVRGYRFDASRIARGNRAQTIIETEGQLLREWEHLKAKLQGRSPEYYERAILVASPQPHPMFRIVPGAVREWEHATGFGPSKASRNPP